MFDQILIMILVKGLFNGFSFLQVLRMDSQKTSRSNVGDDVMLIGLIRIGEETAFPEEAWNSGALGLRDDFLKLRKFKNA